MITKVSYQCEYCGKVFTDDEECCAHEMEERLAEVKHNNELLCWDKNGNPTPLNDFFDIEKVFFVVARTTNAREMFDEIQHDYGCSLCYIYENEDCDTLMYYGEDDKWHNWQAEMDALQEMADKLKE